MVRVQVRLRDGTSLKETVEAPRGSEHFFATEADVVGKFMKLATHVLRDADAARIVELVLVAERLGDAGELARALAGPRRASTGA
jgi:2-methylcitrate dehydratase PrpD